MIVNVCSFGLCGGVVLCVIVMIVLMCGSLSFCS